MHIPRVHRQLISLNTSTDCISLCLRNHTFDIAATLFSGILFDILPKCFLKFIGPHNHSDNVVKKHIFLKPTYTYLPIHCKLISLPRSAMMETSFFPQLGSSFIIFHKINPKLATFPLTWLFPSRLCTFVLLQHVSDVIPAFH